MRTTLDIDDDLLSRAEAARRRTTLARVVEEALAMRLRAPVELRDEQPLELPVFRGGTGLAPGIDPTSNRSLLDAADGSGVGSGRRW